MQFLRQSTAATVKLGPFVDATDGFTAEPGLMIAQTNIRLSKNGGDFAQSNNSAGATHDENGYYDVPLDTIDSGTLGRLRVAVSVAGARPVVQDYQVVPANVFDSLVSGTDTLDVTLANGAHGGTAATLRLGGSSTTPALYVTNSAGTATKFESTGGSGHGLHCIGETFGAGLLGVGGNSGSGMSLMGGVNAAGLRCQGAHGIETNGSGGSGISALGAHGISAASNATGDGLRCIGSAGGHGLRCFGGSSGGNGIMSTSFAGHGASFAGGGSGNGLIGAGGPSGVGIVGLLDIYHAEVDCRRDQTNARDEYTVRWFKNGVRVTSGVTSPALEVVARSNGSDLVASTAMTEISTTGAYKHDETSNRLTLGETAEAIVSATIGGSTRTWSKLVGRDSS